MIPWLTRHFLTTLSDTLMRRAVSLMLSYFYTLQLHLLFSCSSDYIRTFLPAKTPSLRIAL